MKALPVTLAVVATYTAMSVEAKERYGADRPLVRLPLTRMTIGGLLLGGAALWVGGRSAEQQEFGSSLVAGVVLATVAPVALYMGVGLLGGAKS